MTKQLSEQAFKDHFKKGTLPPFVLWKGEEDYTKIELLAYVRKKAPGLGYNVEVYSVGEVSPAEVLGRAATPSLLGGKTLLVLTEVERFVEEGRSYLKEFADKFPLDLILIGVVTSKEDPKAEFLHRLPLQTAVLDFPFLEDKELVNWARAKSLAFSLELDENILKSLAEAFADDLGMLASEIEKLALLFPQGGKISAQAIKEKAGTNIWEISHELTEAIREGRLRDALRAWEEQRLSGERPEKTLSNIFYETANLSETEDIFEALYATDQAIKTGVTPDTVVMPLVISRIAHTDLRIKEEKLSWLK